MWIQHKVKSDGETLDTIAKQYKIKDIKVLLQHPDNKKAAEAYKKKKPLTKGMVVTVLDPNAKCYVTKDGGKQLLLTELEWKQSTAALDKAMDVTAKRMRRELEGAQARHQAQSEVDDEFPIVAFMCSNWVGKKGDEPTAARATATAAVAKLEKVASRRDYKNFESSAKDTERALNDYRSDMSNWLKQLTGSAENWATGLKVTSLVSFTVFGAAASTVIAPAGLVATLATGAGVGAGTGFLSSGANEVGEALSGGQINAVASAKKIATDMAKGAAWGFAGAGVSRFIGNLVAPKLAEKIVSSPAATQMANKLVFTPSSTIPKLTQRFVERELARVGKNLADGTVYMTIGQANMLAAMVTARFVVRLGVGGTRRTVEAVLTSSSSGQPVHTYLDQNATKIKGKMDETKLADIIAKDMEKDPALFKAFDAIVNDNMKEVEGEILAEIKSEIEANMKKAKK